MSKRPNEPVFRGLVEDPAPVVPEPSKSVEYDWQGMEDAPKERPIFVTGDLEGGGVLVQWRTTREKKVGVKGWHPRSFWSRVLSRVELDFEPVAWRESQVFLVPEVVE